MNIATAPEGPHRLPRPAPGRYLAVEDGSDVVLVPLTDAVVRVGRARGAAVFVDDTTVSHRHALIVRRGEATVILDDRSLNGVLVNGRRVREAELRDGDAIALGRLRMRYMEIARPLPPS